MLEVLLRQDFYATQKYLLLHKPIYHYKHKETLFFKSLEKVRTYMYSVISFSKQ